MQTASPLEVSALCKSFVEAKVVDGVSFRLERGECFGLLGPNGAGKTTTLRCCLGLTAPDSGQILLTGEPVPARAREARQRVGVVPQFDNLDPDFSVAENMFVYGHYFGLSDEVIRERLPHLMEFAGLNGRENHYTRALSGGMKRRLTLARALVNQPELLILDEPTTGLDPQARHLIWERLKRLNAEGTSILLTTHFMEEAERLCHRIAVMDAGHLIALGTPRELISTYIEPQVVEVFGEDAPAWAAQYALNFSERYDVSGETVFCYANKAKPLLEHLDAQAGLRYLHRPANLEDVFLKLTGRELRD